MRATHGRCKWSALHRYRLYIQEYKKSEFVLEGRVLLVHRNHKIPALLLFGLVSLLTTQKTMMMTLETSEKQPQEELLQS